MTISRSNFVKAAAASVLAFAALGTASVAQARDNINWSVGINAAPGVVIGATNGRYYAPPAYVQPAPSYYPGAVYPSNVYPSSYYVQPAPVYVAPPVYYRPAPVYYGPSFYYRDGHRGHGHGGHRGHRH